ncbi:MAG: RES domain-containing protein [Acidimicrobiales bacterium]
MSRLPGLGLRLVTMPAQGGVRVHPDPLALPGAPRPGEQPRNRFDDPAGQFRARYLASTLRGALLEVLAGFRVSAALEQRLAEVVGVAGPDDLEPAGVVPPGLLARLNVARIGPRLATTSFVDAAATTSQTVLGAHPLVGAALAASRLGSLEHPAQLDTGTIALGGPPGRRITQVVARVIYAETDAGGLRYASRVDVCEECWAVFDTVEVWASATEQLALGDPDLASACAALGLRLL